MVKRSETTKCNDADGNTIRTGDVVQIHPDDDLFPCAMAIVTEARGWGIVADVYGPNRDIFPVRRASNQFVRIGHSRWMLED
jgi:hypothetical protein